MNYSSVFKVLSIVAMLVAMSFGLSIGVSYFYGDFSDEYLFLPVWVSLFAFAILISMVLYFLGRKSEYKLLKKEVICSLGLGWIISSLIGTLPYILIAKMSFADSFFESVNGFTSSGASVISNVESLPHSLLFWRAFTQWVGGLGIVVFFFVLLFGMDSGSKSVYLRESKIDSSNFNGNFRAVIFKVIAIYLVLSVACAGCFYATGMSPFASVCTMLATVSTGGFSIYCDGFADFGNSVKWVAILFMFIGGVNFALLASLFKCRFRKILSNSEFRAYVFIIVAISLAIFLYLSDFTEKKADIFDVFTNSVFHVVSTLSSTGFSNEDYGQWGAFAHILLFFTMIIGGCAGSTAGGLKIVRALAAIKISINGVEKIFRPNVVRVVRLDGKSISDERAQGIMSFIVMYSIVMVCGMVLFSLFERDLSLGTCIATVVSAISNIGPGLNETGPAQNYAFLSVPSKFLISGLMIMGRLEFYAVIALFMPELWRKFR